MNTVDLLFPVVGSRLPTDHSYSILSACCRLLPCLHNGSVRFGMVPITGQYIGNGLMQIDPAQSRLRLRISAVDIPRVLQLAGKGLMVMGYRIRLGVPQIGALQPAPTLIARNVAIKNATEVGPFLSAARQQLNNLGIGGGLRVPEHFFDREGHKEPIRRVLRIKEVRIVCFSLLVERLNPEESLRLQEVGLGGRRHLGCGIFIPARREENGQDV